MKMNINNSLIKRELMEKNKEYIINTANNTKKVLDFKLEQYTFSGASGDVTAFVFKEITSETLYNFLKEAYKNENISAKIYSTDDAYTSEEILSLNSLSYMYLSNDDTEIDDITVQDSIIAQFSRGVLVLADRDDIEDNMIVFNIRRTTENYEFDGNIVVEPNTSWTRDTTYSDPRITLSYYDKNK